MTQRVKFFPACFALVCFKVDGMLIVYMLLNYIIFYTIKATMNTDWSVFGVTVVFDCFIFFAFFFFITYLGKFNFRENFIFFFCWIFFWIFKIFSISLFDDKLGFSISSLNSFIFTFWVSELSFSLKSFSSSSTLSNLRVNLWTIFSKNCTFCSISHWSLSTLLLGALKAQSFLNRHYPEEYL